MNDYHYIDLSQYPLKRYRFTPESFHPICYYITNGYARILIKENNTKAIESKLQTFIQKYEKFNDRTPEHIKQDILHKIECTQRELEHESTKEIKIITDESDEWYLIAKCYVILENVDKELKRQNRVLDYWIEHQLWLFD